MSKSVLAKLLLCLLALTSQKRAQNPSEVAQNSQLAEAKSLSVQAVKLYQTSNYPEALSFAKQALELREKAVGLNHVLVADSLNNLAAIYRALQKEADAANAYRRIVKIYENLYGEKDQRIYQPLMNYGVSSFLSGDTLQAESCFKRALSTLEEKFGPVHTDVIEARTTLGTFFDRQGSVQKSLTYFQQALEAQEQLSGKDHPKTGALLEQYACEMELAKKPDTAKLWTRARDLLHSNEVDSITVTSQVLQSAAIKNAQPYYPDIAKAQRVQGTVIIKMHVDEAGKVIKAEAICGHRYLASPSLGAAQQWLFKPTEVNGKPVKVRGHLVFHFTLQ